LYAFIIGTISFHSTMQILKGEDGQLEDSACDDLRAVEFVG
jgi:hypothetical protein